MKRDRESLVLKMDIPIKAHEIAQQFCQRQSDGANAKRIYLNTLAVYSLNTYLRYLDITTDLESSDSWNPAMQYLSDVADLDIPDYGRIECRPVLPGSERCYVPPDVWDNRVGYIAAQFDSELRQINYLGFLPTVKLSSVALDLWQPIEAFIENMSETIAQESVSPKVQKSDVLTSQLVLRQAEATQVFTHLTGWLNGILTSGWQMVKNLAPPELSLGFRQDQSPLQRHYDLIESVQVICYKCLNSVMDSNAKPLILILGLSSSSDTFEVDIWIKVSTQTLGGYLPSDLELVVLDNQDQVVVQTRSMGRGGIQIRMSGQSDEVFKIKLTQGQKKVVETFLV
ncbi:MAG: DUF1822 family protein [Cyanobacteria bacterium P01_F01_bin.150]